MVAVWYSGGVGRISEVTLRLVGLLRSVTVLVQANHLGSTCHRNQGIINFCRVFKQSFRTEI